MSVYNAVDSILLRDPTLNRSDVERYFSLFVNTIIEEVKVGKSVVIPGLCTFTWKLKAKTKKDAKLWTEHPYMAEGDKVRLVDNANSEDGEIKGKGALTRLKKEKNENSK